MKEIVLVGGGGHCRSCIDLIEQTGEYVIAGIIDLPPKLGKRVLGYPVIGTDDDIPRLAGEYSAFLVTAGQIRSPDLRRRLFSLITEAGAGCEAIVSPHAHVSRHARIGAGSVVLHGAIVNAGAVVGRNTIINSRALVEHDAAIGDHCHVATGALINGGVKIGDNTFWGSGSVAREYIRVGEACVIGANIFVRQDVPAKTILR